MAIGLALGRIGCFLNGCCYGGPSDVPWHLTFPKYSSSYEVRQSADAQRFSPPYADQASRGEMYGFRIEANDKGATVVKRVDANSPAESAGLHTDDAVVEINGTPIGNADIAKARLFEIFLSNAPLQLKLQSGQAVIIPAVTPPERSRPVHPAQLYSAIDAALLCWLCWAYFPFRRRDGEVIALLLTIHPVSRFLLEMIRTDEPAVFGTGCVLKALARNLVTKNDLVPGSKRQSRCNDGAIHSDGAPNASKCVHHALTYQSPTKIVTARPYSIFFAGGKRPVTNCTFLLLTTLFLGIRHLTRFPAKIH